MNKQNIIYSRRLKVPSCLISPLKRGGFAAAREVSIEKQDLYPTDAILEAANRLMVGI